MAAVNNVNGVAAFNQGTAGNSVTQNLDELMRKKIKKEPSELDTESINLPAMSQSGLQKLFLNINSKITHQPNRTIKNSDAIAIGGWVRTGDSGASEIGISKRESIAETIVPQSLRAHSMLASGSLMSAQSNEVFIQHHFQLGVSTKGSTNGIGQRLGAAQSDYLGAESTARFATAKGENLRLAGEHETALVKKKVAVAEQDKSAIPSVGNEHLRLLSNVKQHSSSLQKEAALHQPKTGVLGADSAGAAQASGDSKLTYAFSAWGKGHQVNIQLSTHSAAPMVLQPSDGLVHQRLADHAGQERQGHPAWVFSDEQGQSKNPHQPPRDEEPAW